MVYLIHFERPYYHARHYVGWTVNLPARMQEHRRGTGARLLAVIQTAGISYKVVRIWHGDRLLEKQIKHQKHTPLLCPICNPNHYQNRMKETE